MDRQQRRPETPALPETPAGSKPLTLTTKPMVSVRPESTRAAELPASTGSISWLSEFARLRQAQGLRRSLNPRDPNQRLVDLASNDYLGLARDPRVAAAAAAAATTWGAGSTGSRLVTGSTTLHYELETELAAYIGAEAALVFSSGYLANLGAITALAGPAKPGKPSAPTESPGSADPAGPDASTGSDTLILSDALNHASLIDGCRLSRAPVKIFAHRDVAQVRRMLAERDQPRAMVITDAVFSVDGDAADLSGLYQACRDHDALLIVDEAHSFGVVGSGGVGAVAAADIAGQPDVVLTVTLSKALGSQGGAVVGSAEVIAHLIDSARTFIFDTGLAPANVGGALQALRILRTETQLADQARENAFALRAAARDAGWECTYPSAAVLSILVGSPDKAVAAAAACREAGVRVGCFRPPSVPDGISRLRLTAPAGLSEKDLEISAQALADAAAALAVQSAGVDETDAWARIHR